MNDLCDGHNTGMAVWMWVLVVVVGWSLISFAAAVVAGGTVSLADRMESHRYGPDPDRPARPAAPVA